ncbi:MAG: AraC family transcriptional regulator [Propionivibrio sp.]
MASTTFLATFGLIGLRLLELHGIEPERFVRELGINSIVVPDTKTRLPSDLMDAAFAKAVALIPDPAFALRVGECWHPSNLGALGYAWLSSRSLRTALKRLERFSKTIGQKATSHCEDGPDGIRFILEHKRGDNATGYAMADFSMALAVSMCRTNCGASFSPRAITLRRPAPEDAGPWEDYYACPIRFAASDDSFLVAEDVAGQALPTANQEFAKTFDAILIAELAALSDSDLQTRCKAFLLDQLTSGEPSEEDLAKAMAMSRRTLQRKLGHLGASYKGLLERVRYDLALRYLDDPGKSVTDITFLLGFSEQSSFTRAFKRWSGQAPTAYRESRPAHG